MSFFTTFSGRILLISALLGAVGCSKDDDCISNPEEEVPLDSVRTFTYFDTLIGDFVTIPLFLPCNGHATLCAKRVNEIFFAMTHNSHADNGNFSALAANQNGNVAAQLNAGIRGLNIKPYWEANGSCGDGSLGLYLYHGNPILGCEPLEDFLNTIRDFLLTNNRECIVMTIEGSASAARLDSIFGVTGLSELMYDHNGGEWPFLHQLITSNKRLIVLSDRSDAEDYPGQHVMWEHTVDVNYDNQNTSQFDCTFDRGNPNGAFFLLNHFLTNLTPQASSAPQTNAYNMIYNRALECWESNSKRPNFVMVDFYASGDVVRAVDSLNLLP